MTVSNSKPQEKGIVMKVKLTYSANGIKVAKDGTISNFPKGW